MVLVFQQCSTDPWDDKRKEEQDKIDRYVGSLRAQGYEVQEVNGIYFIHHGSNPTGDTLETDDYMIINFIGRDLDGNIYETNINALKDQWDKSELYEDYVFAPLKLKFGHSIPGINVGIGMMNEGDSAQLIIPSFQAFNDFRPLDYTIKLIKVIKDPLEYDSLQLDNCLTKEGINDSAFYYKDYGIYFKHEGDSIDEWEANDTLMVNYEAYFLQENEYVTFESTEGATGEFYVSQMDMEFDGMIELTNGMIQAFNLMNVGSHATVVVPYTAGFGANGYKNSAFNYMVVPQYTSLIYKFNIVSKK